jgi:hypothetical protein
MSGVIGQNSAKIEHPAETLLVSSDALNRVRTDLRLFARWLRDRRLSQSVPAVRSQRIFIRRFHSETLILLNRVKIIQSGALSQTQTPTDQQERPKRPRLAAGQWPNFRLDRMKGTGIIKIAANTLWT